MQLAKVGKSRLSRLVTTSKSEIDGMRGDKIKEEIGGEIGGKSERRG